MNRWTAPYALIAMLIGVNIASADQDTMTNPPTPICSDGDFLWQQEVDVTNLSPSGLPILEVRLIRRTRTSFVIPGSYPAEFGSAVTLSVNDTVAWDGYVGRTNTEHQPDERYKFVFFKNGSLVAETDWTGDGIGDDGINTGWESDFWRGPLDQDIFLPDGTDEIRIIHWSDTEFGTGDESTPNSVVPVSVCVSSRGTLASLGDRVWEDLDVNGIQDCEDTNQNSIIGDAGDTGPECGAGIPDVPVNLLSGDCATPLGQMVMTDLDGFYLFQDLDPGAYCVEFGKPPADFCDTDGFDLGEPQFTMQNVDNDDAVDSDADTVTGVTDPVSLAAGQTDLTVDAGIYCPAKIGDRVWTDDDKDGLQDPGEEGVPGVTVKLFECTDGQPIVDNDRLIRTTTTDDAVNDMNYMFGAEPDFALQPGEYFVQFMNPDGTEFTVPNVNGDVSNSDCLPPDGISSCVTLGSRGINLNRDCGLIPPPPPECDLELDKSCRVETPPVSGDLECEAKIAATVLVYTGGGTPGEVIVEGKNNKAQVISSFDDATGILTVDARPEDLGSKMTITTDGVAEVIHTSCSTPYVAGLPAPLDNPKGDPSANWLVLSFVDKNGGSASVPGDDDDGLFTDDCTFTPGPAPSCATLKANDEKLSSLSFAYTGGGCPGDNDQGDKSSCSGSVDPSEGVTVQAGEKVDNLNYPVDPMFVAPDGEFTIDPDKFKSNSALVAGNMGGTEINEFHTSCSQPLAVGDVFGSFTLVAINGQSGSTDVTYQYVVTNSGDPLTDILVTDVPLGDIGGPVDLGTGESQTFTKVAQLRDTTVNTGTASGFLANGEACSASDTVTVEVVVPPAPPAECKDLKPIDALILEYAALQAGDRSIETVAWYRDKFKADDPTKNLINSIGPVIDGQVVNFDGFAAADAKNDVDFFIQFTDGSTATSRFHRSCSDQEMNDISDCGGLQGDGKDNSSGLNTWILRDLAGNGKVLGCP